MGWENSLEMESVLISSKVKQTNTSLSELMGLNKKFAEIGVGIEAAEFKGKK